ncbi:hypothetical protein ACUWC3_28385, partial [Klebsiella pneumoniae]|uniref:hypothetical protein n=1 Tax=Klebsiella pneumoniae TaxID=573 RepID=UPI0040556415
MPKYYTTVHLTAMAILQTKKKTVDSILIGAQCVIRVVVFQKRAIQLVHIRIYLSCRVVSSTICAFEGCYISGTLRYFVRLATPHTDWFLPAVISCVTEFFQKVVFFVYPNL